jgi:hypothetical protein
MNKSLVVALILGVTAATSITGFTKPDKAASGSRYNWIDQDYATFEGFFEFDFGYSTHYEGHAPDELATGYQGESYGIDFYSYFLANFDFSLIKNYENNMRFFFEPLMIAPYTQTVLWSRVEANTGIHLILAGSRTVRFMDFFTIV